MLKSSFKYLAFDDRKLMLIGMPILTMLMPILLNFSGVSKHYWIHLVPESFIFVLGFWGVYRFLIIQLRKYYPAYSEAGKRVFLQTLFILISAPILKAVFSWIAVALLNFCSIEDHTMPPHLQALISIYIPSFLIVATYEAIYYFIQYKKVIIDRERLETQHVQTELRYLRNQINPHFLFNSLNTLMNLIPLDQDRAMSYLSKLSKFYRHAVNAQEEKLIPVKKEIEFATLYMSLLEERFRKGVNFEMELSDIRGGQIPPLSLQLLIENAVKHNVVSKDQPLTISINYNKENQYLTIENNIQKKLDAVASTGMGLENIRKRFSFFTERPIHIAETEEKFVVQLPIILSTENN